MGRRLQHPTPTHGELALAPLLCGWDGGGVSVWFSGISFMPWKLVWAVRGSGEGSQAGGRGWLLERSLPSYWLPPCAEDKIKHQTQPRLVPGLMELGKRLPDVCSCFLPLPTQSLELETHVSCSVGPRAPGSRLGRLVSPSPTCDHSFPLTEPLSPSSVPLLPSKESFHTLSTGKSFLLYSLRPSCSQGLSAGTGQRSRGRNSLKQRGRKERCSG